MEFDSQYLMLLPLGWSPPVIFSGALVEDIETLGGLELQPFP